MADNPNGTLGKLIIGPVVVRQRRYTKVCGLVALANYLNFPYEEVYAVGREVSKKGIKEGFLLRELEEVSHRLGRPMKRLHWKKVRDRMNGDDYSDLSGVLGINWRTRSGANGNHSRSGGHWVFVRRGVLIDPDDDPPRTYEPDEYCITYGGELGWMLVE